MKPFIVVIVLVLGGCNVGNDKPRIDGLEAKIQSAESKLAAAEQRIQRLEESSKDVGNWVLWKRVQYFCPACLYTPARPISAYASRSACVVAATKLIEPNGDAISTDPIEVEYVGGRHLFLNCLPPGVAVEKR